jgi:hypothetical protein
MSNVKSYIIVTLFILITIPLDTIGQLIENDSTIIKGKIATQINTYKDFMLGLTIKNKSNKNINAYTYLEEGYIDDITKNLHIKIEVKKGNKYIPHPTRTYRQSVNYEDSFYFDIPKAALKPKDTITLTYNINNTAAFDKGQYRLKYGIRINTKLLRSATSDYKEYLPEYQYSSGWIYFNVNKPFSRSLDSSLIKSTN